MGLLGYRGRLICPIKIGIARIDTATIESESGYDPVFKTPLKSKPFGARGPREGSRRELAEILLPAQSEILDFNKMRQGPSGDVPDYRVSYVLFRPHLEKLGLIDSTTGKPLIGKNDRITAKYKKRDESLIRTFEDPQVFVTEVADAGEGFDGQTNLLILVTDDRPLGLPEVP